jgi:hypothetical protein
MEKLTEPVKGKPTEPVKTEEKTKNFKKEYKVCVTGFLALGKMFRANEKISSKTYENYIQSWLDKGYIK